MAKFLKRRGWWASILFTLLLPLGSAFATDCSSVTGNVRADRLLCRLSLQEKLSLIHDAREDPATYQGQAGYLRGVPRLRIPGLRLADGPPGILTRRPSQAETATMGVAATFDVRLARLNGEVIGREARALGVDVALQPYINIDRDLTFKRAYNTFGEDPLLTSRIGAAEIRGIQSQHVMAMAKHFIGFDTAATDVWIDEQTLREVYLPPFEAAVHAGVAGIMCSYNHLNGPYACGSPATLRSILRDELGFRGFITSDWGATHSALFMNAGLDVEMIDGPDSTGFQEPAYLGAEAAAAPRAAGGKDSVWGDLYGGQIPEEATPAPPDGDDLGLKVAPKTLTEALADRSITEATVDRAAGDILLAMDRFGRLPGGSRPRPLRRSIRANAEVIELTAEKAAVLLKNDGGALPLRPSESGPVLFIGPTAGQIDAIGISGERSTGLPERQVSPVDAVRRMFPSAKVEFAVADGMTGALIPANLFRHGGAPGLERAEQDSRRSDAQVDFTISNGAPLPPDTRATWSGTLAIPKEGTYWLYLQVLGGNARLLIDGKIIGITGAYQGDVHGDILRSNQDNVLPTTDGLDNVRRAATLSAGDHAIEIELDPDGSHAPAQIRLNWYTPEQRQSDHAAAVAAARKAKAAVVFAWTRRAPAFALPGDQDRLIEDIAAVNPNTIVVLNTSQPVAIPWADRVRAIVEMWWPGDEGGWATGKVLFGRSDPGGRLPVTWAKSLEDYPASDPNYPERSASGVNGKTTFTEGLDVGYRWFDRRAVTPLYPFGHGLSYTTFSYSRLHVTRARDGGLSVSVRIRNTGSRKGDETPQVYLSEPSIQPEGVAFPLRKLVAFDHVSLQSGRSMTVRLHVPRRQLQYWSVARHDWIAVRGRRRIYVGSSSRDLRLEREMSFNAPTDGHRQVG